jgi:hypothetical protein
MKHKTGVIFLIIGGILMIVSFTVGSLGIFALIYKIVATQWPSYAPIFDVVINGVFKWISDLGGVAVIVGAVLILLGALKLGKFIVYFGLAFGTFALIIWIISQIINLTEISISPEIDLLIDNLYNNYSYGTGFQFVGVVIAIIGRNAAVKRKPKVKEIEEKEPEESKGAVSQEKKYCPDCGTELPDYANFCSKCGKTFN